MSDPISAWAPAVTETFKAVRGLGGFFAEPAGEVRGMVTDYLKVVRWERQRRLVDRLRATMRARGLTALDRPIPLNTLLPLVEHAEREEDDDLQDTWAQMLVNAGDSGSAVQMRRAYVSMLADMTAFDVHNLARIHSVRPAHLELVWTGRLPNEAARVNRSEEQDGDPREDVAVSLGNLARLGCLTFAGALGGASLARHVMITAIGRAFVTACTRTEASA